MSFKYNKNLNKIDSKATRVQFEDDECVGEDIEQARSSGMGFRGSSLQIKKNQTIEDIDSDNEERMENDKTSNCIANSRIQLIFRIILVLIAISGCAVAALTPAILPHKQVACIQDQLFIFLEPVNNFLNHHLNMAHWCMIICSLFMDVTMTVVFVVFIIHGKTYRLALSFIMFYILRTITQKMFVLEYPKGYLWGYPGFPSLFVPYGITNDFFFSGHAGGATLAFLEFRHLAAELKAHWKFIRFMQGFSLVTIVLQVILMLSVRGHYSIDLLAGIIFAHYLYIMSSWVAPMFDRVICKLPAIVMTCQDYERSKDQSSSINDEIKSEFKSKDEFSRN